MKPTYRSAAVVAAILALGLSACGDRNAQDDAAPQDTTPPTIGAPGAAPPEDLAMEAESFTAAWNQEDPLLAAEYFTDDAVANVNGTTYTGRQQIMGWLQENVPAASNLETHDERWEAVGDEYRGSGRYTMNVTVDGQTQQASGTFDGTWVRRGDVWRLRSFTANSDNPPPQ